MHIRSILISLLAAGFIGACGSESTEKKPTDTPKPATTPTSGAATPDPHGEDEPHGKKEKPKPVMTAHMMNRFVAALSSKPTNAEPAPDWEVLLADPSNPVACADCHKPEVAEAMSKIPADNRPEGIERWEKDPAFMKHLMKEWVEAVNKGPARKKLKADLTCKSCHAPKS